MPRLLALVPEDGWAFVREGDEIVAVHPPFLRSDRRVVPEAIVADAVVHHGFQAVTSAPEESWLVVIARIRDSMAAAQRQFADPRPFLERALAVATPLVLTKLLDLIEGDWLENDRFTDAENALGQLLSFDLIRRDPMLSLRVADLLKSVSTRRRDRDSRRDRLINPRPSSRPRTLSGVKARWAGNPAGRAAMTG